MVTDAAYASEMLRSLRQISATDSVVGAYFSSPSGSFLKSSLVDAQAIYQTVGGRKGVIVVYGLSRSVAARATSAFAEAASSSIRPDEVLPGRDLPPSLPFLSGFRCRAGEGEVRHAEVS